MAETVTITTFLELKDNMSAGLGKVEAALKKIGGAQASQTKADREQAKAKREQEKAAEKLAKMQQRAARFEEQAAKRRQREFDANAKKAQAASDRAWREIQRQEAAKRTEAIKTQAAISRAHLQAQADRRKAQVEQERTARRLAKAQEREQRQIAKAMLGPKYDPAARAQEQLRAQARAMRQQVSEPGQAFGPKHDPVARAKEQMRVQAQAARAIAAAQERARAKQERDLAKVKKDFQRWGAQEAKAAERLERQKAAAAIRELRRVEAERNRAARAEQRRQAQIARQRSQAKRDEADFIGKAGAAMFGPGVGGVLAAAIKSPAAALKLSVVGLIEGMVSAIKTGLETAYDLTKQFVTKVFDVSAEYQTQIRRVAMVLVGMDVSPTYAIATQQADKYFGTIRDLAAKLPGETNDYLTVFSMGLPKALQQGEKSVQKFAEMASKFTAFGFTMGQTDIQQIGRDIARIMQGQAYRMTAMYRHLEPYIGMAAKEFNKLKPSERMVKLYAAIEKSTMALPDTFRDADALLGTMKTKINEIFRIGGAPLFQSALSIIQRINQFLTDNNDKVLKLVGIISGRLGNVLEGAVIKILEMGTRFDEVFDKVSSVGSQLADWATHVSPFFAILAKITNMVADLGRELEMIGLKSDLQRKQQRQREYYEKLSRVYQDPAVQTWLKTMPRTGEAVSAGQTGVTRDNEGAIKAWAQAGLRMGIPRESWASVLAEAEGIKAHPEMISRWFQSAMPHMEAPAAGEKTPRGAPRGRQTTINDFRFSKFDIRQEFAEGFDPDRIAVAFASDLGKLGEMRMQSAYAPLYAVRGGA